MARKVMAIEGDTNGINYTGNIAFYSRGDNMVCIEELRNLAAKHGLPEDFLPEQIKGHNAFKCATSAIQELRRKGNTGPCVLVRSVGGDRDTFRKDMVIEEMVDINGEQELQYTTVAQLIYERETNSFKSKIIVQGWEHKVAEAEHLFNEYLYFYKPDDIARMTIDGLRKMHSISMRRSGGVEFVPKSQEGLLNSLVGVIKDLGGGWEIHKVPVVDSEEQRQAIAQKFQEHIMNTARDVANYVGGDTKVLSAKNSLQELVAEMLTIMEKGEVSKAVATSALKKFDALGDTVMEYQTLLATNLKETNHLIDVAEKQLREILKEAK